MKCYIEVKIETTKKIPIKEVINDGIKLFKLIGFYEESVETELYCGSAVEETNNVIIKIEKIARKYGLFDDKQCCNNPWYLEEVLLPNTEKFFKEHIIIK